MKKKFGFALDEENSIPDITFQQKESFIKGITDHSINSYQTKNLDPKAKPTYGINVRLNEYQLELIRRACEKEERSQQQVIKRILIPALENLFNSV